MENFRKVKINGKEYTLKLNFRSTQFMGDLDLRLDPSIVEQNPLQILSMISTLFYAGMNWGYDVSYSREETDMLIDQYIEEYETLEPLLKMLIELLESASFFKVLHKNQPALGEVEKTKRKKKDK